MVYLRGINRPTLYRYIYEPETADTRRGALAERERAAGGGLVNAGVRARRLVAGVAL